MSTKPSVVHSDPEIVSGTPVFIGTRVPVQSLFDYLEGDSTSLEAHGLERLAADGQLMAYRHEGFWQCMDTLRDKRYLDGLWQAGKAPWKIWP